MDCQPKVDIVKDGRKMIFVTVGTHEQQFNRLLETIDKLVENGTIIEEVAVQSGYSDYEPKYCRWKKLFSYDEMEKNVSEARIVITHGGPSSFIMPLQIGKTPIVVPRRYEFNEHVNNHQMDFCKAVAERMGTIFVVEDVEKLGEVIGNYDQIVNGMGTGLSSNNVKFCSELDKIVDEMF